MLGLSTQPIAAGYDGDSDGDVIFKNMDSVMYITNFLNDGYYPTSDLLFSRKYVPCICRIDNDVFEIVFTLDRLENLKLIVKDFNIKILGQYAAIAVGGVWKIEHEALITLRFDPLDSQKIEIIDLAFFDLFAGWFWAVKDGEFTEDYVGKDDEELLNAAVYPLQE